MLAWLGWLAGWCNGPTAWVLFLAVRDLTLGMLPRCASTPAALPIIPELVLSAVPSDTTAYKWFYVLRLLRLVRVFRLLKVGGPAAPAAAAAATPAQLFRLAWCASA